MQSNSRVTLLIKLWETGNDFDSGLLCVLEDETGESPYEVLQGLHGSHMTTTLEQTHVSKSNFQQPGYNGLG